MGVEYLIACDTTRERFDLGKGEWARLSLVPCSNEELTARVSECLPWMSESHREWASALAARIREWCERVGWVVYLTNDASDPPQPVWEYAVVGDRYDRDWRETAAEMIARASG